MAYWQVRRALAVWGSMIVGAAHASGTIIFGSAGDVLLGRGAADRLDLATGDSLRLVSGGYQIGADTEITRAAADHLHTADAFTFQGTVGMEARGQANPINTQGGSALTGNGDMGFDGSQLYFRTGGTIYNLTPDGTIAV